MSRLDRVRGMIAGGALGDALGAPHEFYCNRSVPYTGILEHKAFHISRFQGLRENVVGQITDDTEMTLALARSLVRQDGYKQEDAILSYLDWANSGGWMMGRNTRTLLRGVHTVHGYERRMTKVHETAMENRSQSNGPLMRCAPLAVLSTNDHVIVDCDITNPHPIVEECCLLHVNAIRLALQGKTKDEIWAATTSQTPEVADVLRQVSIREQRDVSTNKGWCLHGTWCEFMALTCFDTYHDAIDWVISHPGSDTDTNAAIAGSLLGAYYGYEAMRSDDRTRYNLDTVLACRPTDRPMKYSLYDFDQLTSSLALIS